jgi:hypothetical protein
LIVYICVYLLNNSLNDNIIFFNVIFSFFIINLKILDLIYIMFYKSKDFRFDLYYVL